MGRLRYFKHKWEQIVKQEQVLLSWVEGYKIPFISTPTQDKEPLSQPLSPKESKLIEQEIQKLLTLGAIQICNDNPKQFISSTFLVKKPNGKYRFILNLKTLNKWVKSEHFKLEDIRTACNLMFPGCYMAKIDLKDAYFALSINEGHRQYLCFRFKDKTYQFNVMPFGLCSAPLVFTKIMRPVLAELRKQGLMSVNYLDDFLIIAKSHDSCLDNIRITKHTLESLGFVINEEKSVLIPSSTCKFLGFILDSLNMTINLPEDKIQIIKQYIKQLLRPRPYTIRFLAQALGTLASVCPAVKYGTLYTKQLERFKFLSLLQNKDDYEALVSTPQSCSADLIWWLNKIDNSHNPIRQNNFTIEIFSDASNDGWGACCGINRANGIWTEEEKRLHINTKELKAALFGLKCFAKDLTNKEILLRIDNTTAIAYINRMGGVQFTHLHALAKNIWQWCEARDLWVYASYISSKDNQEADFESRYHRSEIEWELSKEAYDNITRNLGLPEIDLFASRLNNKCKKYISWHMDPEAWAIDAFTIKWSDQFFYAFPPFSMILKSLRKIVNDKATGIMVVPLWETQAWFPLFQELIISDVIILKSNKFLLTSGSGTPHPLHKDLRLAAGILSGKLS